MERDCMNARQGLPGCQGERIEEIDCEDLPLCDLLGQWSQARSSNFETILNMSFHQNFTAKNISEK